ncbi:MAG: RloB family protein [Syntrophomonadaceae bacterium]|jgi:hypothetical protein|nr:RloB family protein [Syntrophomonadaceae bacterium]
MKTSEKYYFSVEGKTEKWYLEWLKNTVNNAPQAQQHISLNCKVQKDPLQYVKRLTVIDVLDDVDITHVFDRESEETAHTEEFTATLRRMEEVGKIHGKTVKYNLGYSNFTFELWMVLHKSDCNGAKNHRHQYLGPINQAYKEQFESLDQYKRESDFKRVLGKLTLDDVKQAIRRSKSIMRKNEENGYICQEESGYFYYKENPSLSIWECIEKMLDDCGLL